MQSRLLGDKNPIHPKGKQPRLPAKVPKFYLSGKGCGVLWQPGGWLRSTIL